MLLFKRKKYKLLTDEELVSLYKKEQESYCLGLLYERYGHLVMGTALKYLKNKTNAEDLTMEIFEGLGQKIVKHEINQFKSWLYVVTKNECFMLLRKTKKEFTNEFIENTADVIENNTDKEMQLQALENTIPALKPEQQQCIELFYLKNKSYQEICEQTGLSLLKVKSAIQNGKRNLKIKLEATNVFKG